MTQPSPAKGVFPQFLDGDVLIAMSTTTAFKLHSNILKDRSPWFAREIDRVPAVKLNPYARKGNLACYRFEFRKSMAPGEMGGFQRVEVLENGQPTHTTLIHHNLINSTVEEDQTQPWLWLLGIFYGIQPKFDDSSLQSTLQNVMKLIFCAEGIEAMDQIYHVADLALLRQDGVLWQSVQTNPLVWIDLAFKIHSQSIFTEAAVHLVGQWHVMLDSDKDKVHGESRAVIEQKADQLSKLKEAIEMRILGHYPKFTTRTAADKPGRPSYSNDIYMWMCICFFRQWFAQCISDDRTRRAVDGGLGFYTALHKSGSAYLTHDDFKEFYKYFPMSIKACHVLEANMCILKDDVSGFVAPLMESHTHVDPSKTALEYLTCATIKKEDLPWYVEPDKARDPNDLSAVFDEIEEEEGLEASERRAGPSMKQSAPRSYKKRKTKTAPATVTRSTTFGPTGIAKRVLMDDDDDDADDERIFVGGLDAMEDE